MPRFLLRLLLLLGCLSSLLLAAGGVRAAAAAPLARNGYLSLTLKPDLHDTHLIDTAYVRTLGKFFTARTLSFGQNLARGLEKTALAGRIRVLPGYGPGQQQRYRQAVEPDNFLVTVDLTPHYGLSSGSSVATCLSMVSCLLLAPVPMFTYQAQIPAQVTVYYVTPERRRTLLLQERFTVREKTSGNFFQVMEPTREREWIDRLTDRGLTVLEQRMLKRLPQELVRRARRGLGAGIEEPPDDGSLGSELPPLPRIRGGAKQSSPPRETATAAAAPRPPGQPLSVPELVRQAGSAVFQVQSAAGTASGFVVSAKGVGLTTLAEVQGAGRLTVRFHHSSALPARVLLTDRRLGLALISFSAFDLKPLPLGKAQVHPGDQLLSLGYPGQVGLSEVAEKVSEWLPGVGEEPMRLRLSAPSPARGVARSSTRRDAPRPSASAMATAPSPCR